MSFATTLALLVGLLVAAPLVAHLLRRRKTERLLFPPARLVLAAQPIARQRARIEDRSLLLIRALAVLALALLGATPFVSCSRLSLDRKSGGSVAVVLVVDDSMSMRASHGSGTRFDRARSAAQEVLASLREGDVVALLAAGAPPRVVLAATSDLNSARAALDTLSFSDRGTDLDGALSIAASMIRALPHSDKRVLLLSDLADGSGRKEPLGEGLNVPIWIPLEELRGRVPDCAVLRAMRRGVQLQADVRCGEGEDAKGRSLQVVAAEQVLATAALESKTHQTILLTLADGTPGGLIARLSGKDAISADDQVPVTAASSALQVAVVSDLTESAMVIGGPSPVEQALAALDESIAIRPLPIVPDDAETLASFALVVLDDPPGLTPEARVSFRTWLERGGVSLLWLGPRAGGAILGASFEPFFSGPTRWNQGAPDGADPASLRGLGEVGEGLLKLAPKGRISLDAHAVEGASIEAKWSDGAPMIFQRSIGRGNATVVTLPASAESSDLPLRPAFLELLSRALESGRSHQLGRRSVVGVPWSFQESVPDEIVGPSGALALHITSSGRSVAPGLIGLYSLKFGSQNELRVVEIDEREINTTPRPTLEPSQDSAHGAQRTPLDTSPYIAFLLLLAITAEAGLRLRIRRETPAVVDNITT